jgi:hypothetical protein
VAKYNVPIVYKGQVNYIVEAESVEEAEELAREQWSTGEKPVELGNEWEKIERFGVVEPVEESNA